jgi:hypothetical protein
MTRFDLRIDTQRTLERLQRQIAAMPHGVERARRRALRKLSTWVQRQVLREASAAIGVPQKIIKALLRYRSTRTADVLSIWIGTNPLKAHHLGKVRWTRRMTGARAGRKLFAGSWSWPASRIMAGLIVERIAKFNRNENPRLQKIDVVTEEVHQAVLTRLEAIQPNIDARFLTLLQQELNYALLHEAAAS